MKDFNTNKKPVGRPKKVAYKKLTLHRIDVTLGADDKWKLDYICNKLGISKADAIRQSVRAYYEETLYMDYPDKNQ